MLNLCAYLNTEPKHAKQTMTAKGEMDKLTITVGTHLLE